MNPTAGRSLALAAVLVGAGPAGAQQWSVKPLPGGESLPTRMASYYRPVAASVRPGCAQYRLPLDLAKLGNADFAEKAYPYGEDRLAERANVLLRRNGFVVFAGQEQEDVADFYKAALARSLPVIITSDAVLHLYRLQFIETLRDLEERVFAADLAAIAKALQGEALKLHAGCKGELKSAARLLVGYATVPLMLLAEAETASEAVAAMKEISSWPARPGWRTRDAFVKKYAELLAVLSSEQGLPTQRYGLDVQAVKIALRRYLKAHPPGSQHAAGEIPAVVAKEVRSELDLIAAAAGTRTSPLFACGDDYSRYAPRGHYSPTKSLRQYYKALTWLRRKVFLIRGRTATAEARVSLAEARKQTLAAVLLAATLEAKLPDGRTIAQAWDRLYAVTAYHAALVSELSCYDYRAAVRQTFGETVSASALANSERFFEFRAALARTRQARIYGGLGGVQMASLAVADESDLARALGETQGLRLIGRPFSPDAYAISRLVSPAVGDFTGRGRPFTLADLGGAVRAFPRGLDVMALLGSKRARQWLAKLGDDRYRRYDQRFDELAGEFGKLSPADWQRSVCWSWLHVLRGLLEEVPEGYPTFMRTPAWQDKQLSTALAGWAQLRRDTALTGRRSRPRRPGSALRRARIGGYVEPAAEFYARLLAVMQMTHKGLAGLKLVDKPLEVRLDGLQWILSRLLEISRKELTNLKISEKDYAFIRRFGDRASERAASLATEGLASPVVADVHRDEATRQVFQAASGHLHTLVAVFRLADGSLAAGVGPVLSYYEFKRSGSDRLTDEAWRKRLREGKGPKLPEWAGTFSASR